MPALHAAFKPPSDPDAPIWRYMDLAKFLSLLENDALYFSRADKVGDAFEGSLPDSWVEKRRAWYGSADEDVQPQELLEHLARRKHTYLSCWHMNKLESVAMWKIYEGGEGKGIAIRSKYSSLRDSINDDGLTLYIGTVRYIDYATDDIDWYSEFLPYVHKRKSFEFEC